MDNNLTVMTYSKTDFSEQTAFDPAKLSGTGDGTVTWVDVDQLGDTEGLVALAKSVGLHHLVIEDILNSNQMVKLDTYDDYLFVTLKMLRYNAGDATIVTEPISIVLKGNLLLSFQENVGDIFLPLKNKIRIGRERIRSQGVDYLFYELIDLIVDNYFEVIDNLGDVTDEVEEELMSNPSKSTLQRIYYIKRELMYLRKSVYPLRELIGHLSKVESRFISDGLIIYLRDVYDHLVQIVETVGNYQDIMSNMLDTYLSSISNKTNDIMKFLTIFSTIFIPLTFLAGVYGMNFRFFPELGFKYGYPIFWGVVVLVTLGLLFMFRRKKWF